MEFAADVKTVGMSKGGQESTTSRARESMSAATSFFELFSESMSNSVAKAGESFSAIDAVKESKSIEPKLKESSTRLEENNSRKAQESSRHDKDDGKEASRVNKEREDHAREKESKDSRAETDKDNRHVRSNRKSLDNDGNRSEAARISAQAKMKGSAALKAKDAAGNISDKADVKADIKTKESFKNSMEKVTKGSSKESSDKVVIDNSGKKTVAANTANIEKNHLPKPAAHSEAQQIAAADKNAGVETSANSQNSSGEGEAKSDGTARAMMNLVNTARQSSNDQGKGFEAAMAKAGAQSNSKGSTISSQAHSNIVSATGAYNKAASQVSQTSKAQATARANQSQIISQIVKAAKITIKSGKEEMKVLLKPENLGWMKVRVSVEGQKVTAHFAAENEYVKNILEQNMNQLQQSLNSHNLKVTNIQVDVNAHQNSDLSQANEQNGGQRGKGNKKDLDLDDLTGGEEIYVTPELLASENMAAVDMKI